jgi:hypothetical protein
MLANRGTLEGVRILSPASVKLMTTNLLSAGVPMQFTQPFTGVGYGMNVGIVLDPSHADFNGGANGAGTFYLGRAPGLPAGQSAYVPGTATANQARS